METVGILASGVMIVGVLVAAVVTFRAIPDIRQYRRLRNM